MESVHKRIGELDLISNPNFHSVLYLLSSIALSSGIFLLFQAFPAWKVDAFKAIVINYGVAAGFGFILAGGWSTFLSAWGQPWVPVGLTAGFLFIYLFQLIAKSTQQIGVTVTSIAAKLSMVLPVAVFLVLDPTDHPTWNKLLAIALAIPAIVFASWKGEKQSIELKLWLMPLVIFIGSGLIDLMFAGYSGPEHMSQANFRYLFPTLPLSTAFIAGFGWLMIQSPSSRSSNQSSARFTWIGGIILGIINFGSLYFLLETYDKIELNRSAVMPMNNLGIILLSAIASIVLFKEKLTTTNVIGLALGVVVILLLQVDS